MNTLCFIAFETKNCNYCQEQENKTATRLLGGLEKGYLTLKVLTLGGVEQGHKSAGLMEGEGRRT